MDSGKYRCTICKFDYPFEEIRYSEDGKKLLCTGCSKVFKNKVPKAEIKAVEKESDDSVKVICMDCRYNFRLKKAQAKKICPYCGKSRLMKQEGSAQRLIDDVSKHSSAYI